MSDAEETILHRLPLRDEADVASARLHARAVSQAQGLPRSAVEALATAVSEIARNVIVHGGGGELLIGTLLEPTRIGVLAIARDDGPGISNIDDALVDGYSTRDGLGLGLPSARRLVDEFELRSSPQQGTTVTLKQWFPRPPGRVPGSDH